MMMTTTMMMTTLRPIFRDHLFLVWVFHKPFKEILKLKLLLA